MSVKKVLPFVLALCGTIALGQNSKQSASRFTGIWKVKLLCEENYCQGPAGIKENATGGVESQTWTLAQENNTYVLGMGQNQPLLKNGIVTGSELQFNRVVSGTGAASAQQIIITIDKKGRLVGKLNIAPNSPDGVCIKRYKVTGQQ